MKRFVYTILTLIWVLGIATSCQDKYHDLVNPNNVESFYVDTTYVAQFKRMWQGIDVGYVFWQWEKVDWDRVYDTYLPVFEAADKYHQTTGEPGMTYEKYESTWKAIISPLLDHHMTAVLYRPDDPKMERIMVSPSDSRADSADYHRTFRRNEHIACLNNMLDKGQISGHFQVDSALSAYQQMEYFIDGMFSVSGQDSVAYFYISSFMLPLPYQSNAASNLIQSFQRWLTRVIGNPNTSVILDTRNNGGGYSAWAPYLGQFFTKDAFYDKVSYCKAGFNRLDYTPGMKDIVEPNSLGICRQMSDDYPFVCLFDQHSVSNGEEIPWMFSYLPGYVSVGERTCGGMGTLQLDNYTTFFSGTFGNSHLIERNYKTTYGNYYCYMSTMANVDARTGQTPEGIGMIPMIPCLMDTTAFFSGQSDNQLLRAINYLRNKR